MQTRKTLVSILLVTLILAMCLTPVSAMLNRGDEDGTNPIYTIQTPPSQKKLTINLHPHDGSGGTVNCSTGFYPKNTVLTILATATSGYEFDHFEWKGHQRTNNPLQIVIDQSENLEVWFNELPPPPPKYSLTISVQGQGTTDPETGVHLYDSGDMVTVTATADAGWTFSHWHLDGVNNSSYPISIEMCDPVEPCSNHTIVAIFNQLPPPPPCITVIITSISCIPTTEPFGYTSPSGTISHDHPFSLLIYAYPAQGWFLQEWRINGAAIGDSLCIGLSICYNSTVQAIFNPIPIPPEPQDLTIRVFYCGDVIQDTIASTTLTYSGTPPASITVKVNKAVYDEVLAVFGTVTFIAPYKQTILTDFEYGNHQHATREHSLWIKVTGVPSTTVILTY